MTYEEIKEKYPIGKVLYSKTRENVQMKFWYNPKDLEVYQQSYFKVEIFPDNTCKCHQMITHEDKVEGWLYDGEEWRPAYDTWDGWRPYYDEHLEELEVKRLKEEYWDTHIFEF